MSEKAFKYCGICDTKFPSIDAVVKHYRKNHPEKGFDCYDSNLTIGDKFADTAIEHYRQHMKNAHSREAELKTKLDGLQKLIPQYNAMARAITIIDHAILMQKESQK